MRGGFNDLRKTLLVPVSFGVSSISLLHSLNQQLQNRRDQGHYAGYTLHVLFVDQSAVQGQACPYELKNMLVERYPSHIYTTILLEDSTYCGKDAEMSHIDEKREFRDTILSLSSNTSKTDVIDIKRRQLIEAFAKEHKCDGILFGDTTTRLAERTLAETAKGRGIALPWLTADGNCSGLKCVYPLRDLLRKELVAYASIVSPPLTSLILQPSVRVPTSSKDSSIDGLMSQYFESVEQNYPSIVINVVRTSSKLDPLALEKANEACCLCHYPIVKEAWGGDQDSVSCSGGRKASDSRQSDSLCYACERTVSKD